jgi:hypothetical protein
MYKLSNIKKDNSPTVKAKKEGDKYKMEELKDNKKKK